jgi:hypothetical protein
MQVRQQYKVETLERYMCLAGAHERTRTGINQHSRLAVQQDEVAR